MNFCLGPLTDSRIALAIGRVSKYLCRILSHSGQGCLKNLKKEGNCTSLVSKCQTEIVKP